MIFSIERAIAEINKEIQTLDFGTHPKNLYDPLYYLMGLGGKRLRPLLAILSHHLFSDNLQEIIKPAVAVEVFHNFTLMHDDIMDKAPLRRGKPTVHEKWDSNVAILAGDVMLVKAYDLLLSMEEKYLKRGLKLFNDCASGVCEGQQLDVDFEKRLDVNHTEYIEMITLKTAVLLGFSLEIGALLGNASEADALLLRKFGVDIGIAFQLKDDLLDVFGDAEKFGKKVGGDILAKKKTYLLIESLRIAKGADLKVLQQVYFEGKFTDEEKVEKVTQVYRNLNIEGIVSEKMNAYFQSGIQNLSKVNADLRKKLKLRNFIEGLMQREN